MHDRESYIKQVALFNFHSLVHLHVFVLRITPEKNVNYRFSSAHEDTVKTEQSVSIKREHSIASVNKGTVEDTVRWISMNARQIRAKTTVCALVV